MQNRMWPNNCFYLDQPVFLIIIESQNCVEIDELHSPSRNVREQQMGKLQRNGEGHTFCPLNLFQYNSLLKTKMWHPTPD